MKIMVAINKKGNDAKVDERFGRAPFLVIYDKENKQLNFFENDFKNEEHGVANKVCQFAAGKGISMVIAGNFGANAISALKEAEIDYKKITNKSLEHIIMEIDNDIN